ncbi:hypothetical protein C8R47DRAFT_569300 [Mycena vitilis]|nr:hypothetical protein C8R47DRAFT_569300 [Mycena vitilis]
MRAHRIEYFWPSIMLIWCRLSGYTSSSLCLAHISISVKSTLDLYMRCSSCVLVTRQYHSIRGCSSAHLELVSSAKYIQWPSLHRGPVVVPNSDGPRFAQQSRYESLLDSPSGCEGGD